MVKYFLSIHEFFFKCDYFLINVVLNLRRWSFLFGIHWMRYQKDFYFLCITIHFRTRLN
jgi:hypothetical protein